MAKRKKNESAVRVASLAIVRMDDATYTRWRDLSRETQRMINYIHQLWLCWHVDAGTPQKIEEFLRELAAWKDGGEVGDKPKIKLEAMPNDLSNKIYHACSGRFPLLHSRVRVLLANIVTRKLLERKAAYGALSGWWSILLGNESLPSTHRGNPIPFDKDNSEIVPPATAEENWQLRIKVQRDTDNPKGKVCPSIEDTIGLWSKGQKAASQVATLKKIASGEYTFRGSNLLLKNDGKWYAQIAYSAPIEAAKPLDPGKVATLSAGETYPWRLNLCGWYRSPGGSGKAVEFVRLQLMSQRRSRQECYRQSSSSRTGHGRAKAQDIVTRLTRRWRDFVKTFNHQVTSDVVSQCVADGIGKLVYVQPTEKWSKSAYLATAGKSEDRRESSAWDWYQVKTMLSYKCQDAGIVLECVDDASGPVPQETAGPLEHGKGVAAIDVAAFAAGKQTPRKSPKRRSVASGGASRVAGVTCDARRGKSEQ